MQSDNIKDSIKDIQKDGLLTDRRSFITLKVERIAIAAYQVTDFLPHDEPLKWKIRSTATEMVIARVSQVFDPLSRLSILFSIAVEARLGSRMNFSILMGECEVIKSALMEEEKKMIKDGEPLPLPSKDSRGHTNKREPGSRADTILAILKEMGESSIGAISAQLLSVSEKTVQRELISLVEMGAVKRVGERRWSTYQLVKSD